MRAHKFPFVPNGGCEFIPDGYPPEAPQTALERFLQARKRTAWRKSMMTARHIERMPDLTGRAK
jgi:hypothetical protein